MPLVVNPLPSDLDQQQIVQRGYEETLDAHRIKIQAIDPAVVIPVTQGALSVLASYNIPFSSLSHTTPFTVTSGLGQQVNQIIIADTTGQTYKMSWGSTFMYTNPGCEHQVDGKILPSIPITIQSQETSDPVAGNFIITLLG